MKLGTKTGKAVIEFLELEWQDGWLGLELKPIKPKQTDSQRGFYWASLTSWGKSLGYSAKESERHLHPAVCCECWGVKQRVQIGQQIVEIPNETSSSQRRDEYSELIRTLIRLAAENGFFIDEPGRVA